MTAHRGDDPREVVKVRLRAHVYTSKQMPRDDARALRDDLLAQVTAIGGATGFVEFTDRHGREVTLRAREVSIVEVGVPDTADDIPGRRRAEHGTFQGGVVPTAGTGTAAAGGQVVSMQVNGRVDEDGSEFLRRAARDMTVEGSMGRHPAGRHR